MFSFQDSQKGIGSGVRHPVWPNRNKGRRQQRTQSKLAVASVSGVAGPWVRWAILKEGRERSGTPLALKPLSKIPHFVSPTTRGSVGDVIQWQVSGRRRLCLTRLRFHWISQRAKGNQRWNAKPDKCFVSIENQCWFPPVGMLAGACTII